MRWNSHCYWCHLLYDITSSLQIPNGKIWIHYIRWEGGGFFIVEFTPVVLILLSILVEFVPLPLFPFLFPLMLHNFEASSGVYALWAPVDCADRRIHMDRNGHEYIAIIWIKITQHLSINLHNATYLWVTKPQILSFTTIKN